MQEKVKTFLNAIAGAYILIVTAALPLYMKNGFTMIGDAKYSFYFNASLLFFFCSAAGAICLAVKKKKAATPGSGQRWPLLDSMMLLYGVSVVLSYCFSDYKETALFGYADWHMGLATQLLLIWSYFFISRCFAGEAYLWKVMAAAAFMVFAIAVLNRYGYDPLGCFQGMGWEDWNRTHLLSTIGNVNWYCGYVCVALPFLLYFFWSSKGIVGSLSGIGSFIGFVTLFTQGSASGFAGIAAILVVLFAFSVADRDKRIRFLEIVLLFFLTPFLIVITLPMASRGLMLPEKSVETLIRWKGWGILALLTGLVLLWCLWSRTQGKSGNIPEEKISKIRKIYFLVLLVFMIAGVLAVVLCQLSDAFWQSMGGLPILKMDEDWGSGRGVVWKLSLQCFWQENMVQKLFGAGPDCFACIMGEMFDMDRELFVSGQWQGAVFANAHNEWLNMLITCGILGAVSYLGIFAAAFSKFSERADSDSLYVLGIMMTAGYAANDFFSFQQIITTPIVFVVLGMLGSRSRENAALKVTFCEL